MLGEQLGHAGRQALAHGYAVTVHRSQGATVERTHALEDGGGRELAYVKMSRATDRSTVYVVADSVEQAAEDLRREWKAERRLTWAIDHAPAPGRHVDRRSRDVDAALRRGRLLAERHAILAAVPTDPLPPSGPPNGSWTAFAAGGPTWRPAGATTPTIRSTVRCWATVLDHEQAQANVIRLQGNLDGRRLPRRERREKETQLVQWRARLLASARTVDDIRTPEGKRIDKAEAKVAGRLAGLYEHRELRGAWLTGHPEAALRLASIDREVKALDVVVGGPAAGHEIERGLTRGRPWLREAPVVERTLDLGIGL